MDSTTNVCASTETLTFGNSLLNSSTICPWPRWSRIKSSACMAACPPPSTLLTKSDSLTAFRRRPTKAPFATCSGLTPMIGVVGVFHRVALATALAKTSPNSLTTLITWRALLAPISSSWMGTIGRTNATSSRSSQPRTTATAAETKPPSWRWTSTWNTTCKLI